MSRGLMVCASAMFAVAALGVSLGPFAEAAAGSRLTAGGDENATEVASATTQDDTVTMTLLHNNDGESKLLPDTDAGFPGIARFTQTLQDLGTATDADILLRVTSGDNFLASKEFSVGLAREGEPLYDSIALSGLYEAMALGNHDFDFGPEVTARFVAGFSPPVPFLAANIDVGDEPALASLADAGTIAPSVVITDPTSGLQVGVIGAITPRLANISSPRAVRVERDLAGVINAEVESLAAQGVDRIVLISHLQGLSEDEALVPQLRGVDIVVAGGGDELLKNDGDSCMGDEEPVAPYPLVLRDLDGSEVPLVTAPGGYRCIGQLDVTFDAEGALLEWTGQSIGVATDAEAEAYVVDAVETPLIEALAELETTVIGTSDVELDGRRTSVRTASSNLGELLADALLAAGQSAAESGAVGDGAVVAVQNAGGIRNDALIAAGDLSEADTFDIAPFANYVVTLEVPRERFKELLEVGVSGLPDAAGQFPQISGFAMAVDPTQPAREVDSDGDCSVVGNEGSRVRDVTLDDGTEIVRDGAVVAGDGIVVATIDFLANGGDCYPLADLEVTGVGVSYQQALSSFISDTLGGEVTAEAYPAGGSRSAIEPADPGADGATGGGESTAEQELPNTGLESWAYLIASAAAAAGGAMIVRESRRASRLSLANRLDATRAWSPDGH